MAITLDDPRLIGSTLLFDGDYAITVERVSDPFVADGREFVRLTGVDADRPGVRATVDVDVDYGPLTIRPRVGDWVRFRMGHGFIETGQVTNIATFNGTPCVELDADNLLSKWRPMHSITEIIR